MEGKIKYFFMGIIMLLIILMFKEDLAYEVSKWYNGCDHWYETVTVTDKPAWDEVVNNTTIHHDAQTHTEEVLRGGNFTSTDNAEHWWFTSSDLLEFGGEYYCMYAGKSMHSFEHNPGWVTHIDSHDSSKKMKFWHTNYYWEPVFGHTADFTQTAGCVMYNYKEDSNSETKRGRLGVQAAIWAEGSNVSKKIGGGLDDSHAENTGFSNAQEYQNERKFYDIEAHENININSVIGKTLPVSPTEGLLPDEEFYMYLDFPIIFGSVPTGTKNGTTTTYEGEFGKIEITNGTLVAVPSNKKIEGSGNYQYTIKINTGDLSSNVVDVNVTKYFYDYSVKILYSLCQNSEDAQPTGNDGTYSRSNKQTGNTVMSKDSNFSFRINSDVAIKHYIHSIGGEDHYKSGSMVVGSGIGGRKNWNTATKLSQPAVGELGDEIIYKIIVENYTKANIYINIEGILPTEATFISATHDGNGNPVNWKLVPMPEATSSQGTLPTTPVTKEITLIARMNIANYNKAISTAKIVKVFATKAETYDMKNVAKSRFSRIEEDQDAFTTKKYEISIDQYIVKVNHQETRGGTGVTYLSETREKRENNWKLNDSVFVEYGDVITYKFVLYNTNYGVDNASEPWFNPDTVTADLIFELPKKYQLRSISSTDTYENYKENKDSKKVEFSKVRIGRNSTTTITLTLVAEEVKKDTLETTTLSLTEVYNRNNRNTHEANPIENTSGRTTVKERYCLNSYNAPLEEYIDTYNAEMTFYNDKNGFTQLESQNYYNATEDAIDIEGFETQKKTYSNNLPLELEKYETLRYKTIIRNESVGEAENKRESYKKYKTRVRPTEIKQTIDYGLTQYGYKIYWYHASSEQYEEVSNDQYQNRIKQTLTDTGSQWIYTYYIIDENIILCPGDALFYFSDVEATESNLCIQNLKFKSEIITLSNINRKDEDNRILNRNDDRIVTTENLALEETNDQKDNNKTVYTNYVRLKDLIISGTVWIDENRNGYQDNGEGGKNGVVVRLYGNTNPDEPEEYILIKETKTYRNEQREEDGYYNFGRVNKSWKDSDGNYTNPNTLINYYVEFEYYGQMYKATEVYGGINDGETRGAGNLSVGDNATNETISYWRQGYNGLPESQSEAVIHQKAFGIAGRTQYMIDSNAYEFDNTRSQFNEANKTIGFNQAYESGIKLEYTKDNHKSTLNEENAQPNTRMTARSFINQSYRNDVNGDNWQQTHRAENTHTLSLFEYSYSNSYNYPRYANFNGTESANKWKTEKTRVVETEYLKYINLGLVKREEVDLSLEADVHTVKTTINGEEMTYDYSENNADSTKSTYNQEPNAYRLDEAYDLDIYTTDYYYRTSGDNEYYKKGNNTGNAVQEYNEDGQIQKYKTTEESKTQNEVDINSSELNTEVTYRVKITNNVITGDESNVDKEAKKDIPVETAINELTIYYDKNFIKADNTSTVTVKEKNAETGLLEDKTPRVSRINYSVRDANKNEIKKGELTINDVAIYENSKGALHDEYQVMYLTGMENLYLKEGEYVEVYITLTVDKEKNTRNLKITEDEDMGLEVIAEISAYTAKYADDYFHKGLAGKYAALVDRDSNPGNLLIYDKDNKESNKVYYNDYRDYENYEDDTYKVGIKVGLLDGHSPDKDHESKTKRSDERTITGMVFEDTRSETAKVDDLKGVQYLGNGIYNKYIDSENGDGNHENALTNPNVGEGDKAIEGVKVSLVEVVQIGSCYYEYPARYTYEVRDKNGTIIHKKGSLIETRTDKNGAYQLDHFIPGYYKVRFDYGDNSAIDQCIIYNGQDYKSTTYYNEYDGKLLYYNKDNSYGDNDNIGSSDKFSYFDKVKNTLSQKNYSDAQDDEIRRLNVNSYSETMTAMQAKVFNELNRFKESLTKNTHMYAETAIFYVKPEDLMSKESHIVPSQYRKNGQNFNTNTTRLWQIHNLDFGLEYRPEASIMLDKEISTLELVTSDNKTLIKLYFEGELGERKINEQKSIGYENVQFLQNNEKKEQGFVYINMDTDILEGCTIKVEYEMTATNESEVDRINANLDEIKYESQAAGKQYTGVYTTHNVNKENDIKYTYNANATAAQFMASQYYANYNYDTSTGTELFTYLTKLKKPYIANGEITVKGDSKLKGQGYYGMYLGETYYTGKIGANDKVAMLKVDNILDYVDNDFTFSSSENNKPNRLWQAVTSAELIEGKVLDKENVNLDKTNNLIDNKGIRYTTDKKTNLALSVDSNKAGNNQDGKGNEKLSDFKYPVKSKEGQTNGMISVVATKVIAADDVSLGKGLSYENIAEVVQYTTVTGRRTTLPKVNSSNVEGGGVIGNANVAKNWTGVNKYENDTDAAEIITISPPTGLIK